MIRAAIKVSKRHFFFDGHRNSRNFFLATLENVLIHFLSIGGVHLLAPTNIYIFCQSDSSLFLILLSMYYRLLRTNDRN